MCLINKYLPSELSLVVLYFRGCKADEVFEYTIVGSTEADPMIGKISNESPVGAALLECKMKEEVEVIAPKGSVKYKVISMKY